MDIINKFLKSSWSKKGHSIAHDSAKMMLLLNKLRGYMGKGGLTSIKDDLLLMYNYVKDIANGRYREYKPSNLALILAALIYGVSPLDFVADFIPFGLIDDIAIISWALNRLTDEFNHYRTWIGQQAEKEEQDTSCI